MKVTGNVKYIPAGTTQYVIDGNDGEINVDTSVSAITVILPNIVNSGYANSDKGFIINDFSGNAATNNITIIASNNTVNSQASITISVDGGTAKCSIASLNEWFAVTEPTTNGGISGTLTPNYIPKAQSASVLNDSIIYQSATGIGIGTIIPQTKLHVTGTNGLALITSARYSSDTGGAGFIGAKARGTEAAPSAVLAGDFMLTLNSYGYNSGGAFSTSIGKMVFYAAENFTASAQGTAFKLSTTPIGATVDVFNFGINPDGDVSIGDTTLTSTGSRLQVNTSNTGDTSLSLGGADFFGAGSSVTGLSLLLGVNIGNNKQLWIADQDKLTKNSTNPVLQVGLFGTSPTSISAISTSGLVNLDLVLQANGGNLGVGTGVAAPTAKLHVKGIDATSSNYAMKLDDSTNSSLVYVRNDGNLKITPSGSGTIALEINTRSAQDAIITLATNSSVANRATIYIIDADQTLNFYTRNNDTIFWNGNGAAQSKTLTLFTNTTAKFENNLGVGITSATNTRLHVSGVDSTATNFALKVDNSSTVSLFSIKNNGLVSAPLLQTGNSGLASGDLYVDTAANILANSDKVVGWKV